jgi:hypothetical protein
VALGNSNQTWELQMKSNAYCVALASFRRHQELPAFRPAHYVTLVSTKQVFVQFHQMIVFFALLENIKRVLA